MSLLKKLSLLFLASFIVLLFNMFPFNNDAYAKSSRIQLQVVEDTNGNKAWNKPSVDKCYTGDVEIEVTNTSENARSYTYTSGLGNCWKIINLFNSPEGTSYKVKIIKPAKALNYIDVNYYDTTGQHSTFTGSAISARAVNPSYSNSVVTFGLKPSGDGDDDLGEVCSDPKLIPAGKDGNTFTVKIKNPCNSKHKYQLKANPPGGPNSGWKAKISGNNVNDNDVITVDKNDTAQFKVIIDPPDNPSAGTHTTVVLATQKDKASNRDTINLKTEISQDQSCTRKKPALFSADADKNGKKGETVTYNVELKNNNSTCKDPADFNITVDKPNNWTVKILNGQGDPINGDVNNLNSEKSRLLKVKITSPNNAQNNDKQTITINAVQKGHTNLKDSIALKYTVGQDDNTSCTGSEIKPYFECQNNACVAVQACGNNSGGCTSAGGSCTDNGGDPTKVSFVIGLDAIGTTGTNTVKLSNNSNKDPKHPQRKIYVEIFNNSNDKAEEVETDINYVADEKAQNYGKFIGTATLSDDLNTGNYIVKVKVDGRLKKQIPGIQRLEAGKINPMVPINLIAGDIDNDNKIGILDYGILISCSIFAKTDVQKDLCDSVDSYRLLSDLNDDGDDENTPKVDHLDYGYFIQEYSVQNGD